MPRALHALGALEALVTDIWSAPRTPRPARRLGERYDAALGDARVLSGGVGWYAAEAALRLRRSLPGSSDWSLLLARNALFDRMATRRVRAILDRHGAAVRPRLFAYSYASARLLTLGAQRGCHAVMGQIDGGPVEEEIVLREKAAHPELRERHEPAPSSYWLQWRAQCAAASRIVVNSPWSRECLERAGIDDRKMVTVPLYYEAPGEAPVRPALPDRFDPSRPLRVLYLGQLTLRKGAARLFDAVRRLRREPVEFIVVGPSTVEIPDDIRGLPGFRYAGPVRRSETARHYREADVFLLPTLSDGFAITQLEARAHGLPVIASRFCGPVVTHGVDGLLLSEVTGEAIADCLRALIAEPERLARLRSPSRPPFASLRDYGMRFIEETCG